MFFEYKSIYIQAPKVGANDRSATALLPRTKNGGDDFSLPSIFLSKKTMP